jgi:hypothetical protein
VNGSEQNLDGETTLPRPSIYVPHRDASHNGNLPNWHWCAADETPDFGVVALLANSSKRSLPAASKSAA